MIGLIRMRAKAGMTIPAAPRITSASLNPEVPNSPCIPALEQVVTGVSPLGVNAPEVREWRKL